MSYAPIVQRVAPAVVNVYAAKIVQAAIRCSTIRSSAFGGGPDTPRSQIQRSLGSGVIVGLNLIVTNNHVIRAPTRSGLLADKREFDAAVVLKDARTDLAVLRIAGAHEKFPSSISRIRRAAGQRRRLGDRQSVRRRADGDAWHRFGGRAHPGRHQRRGSSQNDAAISPAIRCALVGLDGKLPASTPRSSRGRQLAGHRFRHPRQHGAGGGGVRGSGGKAVRRPWLGAKLQHDRRDRRHGPQAADRR